MKLKGVTLLFRLRKPHNGLMILGGLSLNKYADNLSRYYGHKGAWM